MLRRKSCTAQNMPEYGLPLTHIFAYFSRIAKNARILSKCGKIRVKENLYIPRSGKYNISFFR